MTEAQAPGIRSDTITDVAQWVWDTKYRLRRGQRAERDLDATWQQSVQHGASVSTRCSPAAVSCPAGGSSPGPAADGG